MWKFGHITLVLIVVHFASPYVCCQSTTGTGILYGVISDLSGSPIANAEVYAIDSEDFRTRFSTLTSDDGSFLLKVRPGDYEIHAFKEADNYPDTFFSFFSTTNKEGWQRVHVPVGGSIPISLKIGPKFARLTLIIKDQRGRPIGGAVTFVRQDDPNRPYQRGADLDGQSDVLVPPVPFHFYVRTEGCQSWHSDVITPQSGNSLVITARLRCSR